MIALETLLIENDPVDEFIHRRFPEDNGKWTDGNCFWFAFILKSRFPGGKIVHEPVVGHFLYFYKGKYYDWTGEFQGDTSHIEDLEDEKGSSYYISLIENCII